MWRRTRKGTMSRTRKIPTSQAHLPDCPQGCRGTFGHVWPQPGRSEPDRGQLYLSPLHSQCQDTTSLHCTAHYQYSTVYSVQCTVYLSPLHSQCQATTSLHCTAPYQTTLQWPVLNCTNIDCPPVQPTTLHQPTIFCSSLGSRLPAVLSNFLCFSSSSSM